MNNQAIMQGWDLIFKAIDKETAKRKELIKERAWKKYLTEEQAIEKARTDESVPIKEAEIL